MVDHKDYRPYKSKANKILKSFEFNYGNSNIFIQGACCKQISSIEYNLVKPLTFLASSLDGKIHIVNNETITQTFKFKSGISKCQWNMANENEVFASCYDKKLYILDPLKGISKATYEHLDYLTSLAQHPNLPNIILTGSINKIIAWDVRVKNHIRVYNKLFGKSLDTLFISENCFVNSGDLTSQSADEVNLLVWDFNSSTIISNQMYKEKYTCPKLYLDHHNKDGMSKRFFAQTNGNYIAIFSASAPYKMNRFKRFMRGHTVNGFAIGMDQTANGQVLVSGSADGKLYLYNAQTTGLIKVINCKYLLHHYKVDTQTLLPNNTQGNQPITCVTLDPLDNSKALVGDYTGNICKINLF